MATAIVAYLVAGLLVGLVVRLTISQDASLVGPLGGGGAGGLIGGVGANLLFSDGIGLDLAGWLGSVALAIIVVLVMRTTEGSSPAPGTSGET